MVNVIHLTNTWAQFEGPNVYQAREVLSYKKKGYQFTRPYKRGVWNGDVRLMDSRGKFPAGLAPWLVERLAQEGIAVEIDDIRPAPMDSNFRLGEMKIAVEFRPHQNEAVAAAFAAERGIIWHPTAAGKTEVMLALNQTIARPGLVLVHRKDLMYQAAEVFETALNDKEHEVVGIIGDGLWEPRIITVATFQTLYKNLDDDRVRRWLQEDIGQVHVDEAHHMPAASFEKVMAQLLSARWRYGYSATPFKEGDEETFFRVSSWLGPTVHRVTSDVLAEAGYVVPADVFMIRLPAQTTSPSSWANAERYGIMENTTRNMMIVDLANSLPKPVVILVKRIEHGKELARSLRTEFIAGDTPTTKRQAAWEAVRQGEQSILVASTIADEGLNIPQIQCILMAGGGKAPYLTIQRIGRGMRPSPGKSRLFVLDFLDTGKYLKSHATQRMKTYSEQPACTVTEVEFEDVYQGERGGSSP